MGLRAGKEVSAFVEEAGSIPSIIEGKVEGGCRCKEAGNWVVRRVI